MRRNYRKFTALIATSALLISLTGCSRNAAQIDKSVENSESSGISVSDNEADTLSGSTAEEETQKQSTEGNLEAGSTKMEADPSSEEETQLTAASEETSGADKTSDDAEESSADRETTSLETAAKETTEKETATKEAGTTKAAATVQSIKASVSGTHYIGDTLTGTDFAVTVTMSDGSTLTNPAGWSANPLTLSGMSNQITVAYEGVSTTITVKASEKPAATTAAPQTQPAAQPTTTPAANTQTYGLDAVPEGLEIEFNDFNSTCLVDLTPTWTASFAQEYHYNGEYISPTDYKWRVLYQGNNGEVCYQLTDEAKKQVTGLENIIVPAKGEGYRTQAYYKGITFNDVIINETKGYRPDTYDEEAAQLEFALFNQERNSMGLNSFIWSDTLADLAKIRAKELESDYSHNGCFDYASEIITFGFNSEDPQSLARGTFASWKGSKGHYNTILIKRSEEDPNGWQFYCGIAYYRSVDGAVYAVAIITHDGCPIFDGVIERDPAYLQ